MASQPFSIVVECTQRPRDRRRARDVPGAGSARATSWPASPRKPTTWAFAEGIEDRFDGIAYDTYFLLGNNAGDTDVTVKATFLLEDGTGFQDTFDIGAHSRNTLHRRRRTRS